MSVQAGIWDKLTRVVVVLLCIAGLLLVAVWYFPLIKTNERMRQNILALDNRIKVEEKTRRELEEQILALRTDPKTIERLARETLGYAKPGETIIRFERRPADSMVR